MLGISITCSTVTQHLSNNNSDIGTQPRPGELKLARSFFPSRLFFTLTFFFNLLSQNYSFQRWLLGWSSCRIKFWLLIIQTDVCSRLSSAPPSKSAPLNPRTICVHTHNKICTTTAVLGLSNFCRWLVLLLQAI